MTIYVFLETRTMSQGKYPKLLEIMEVMQEPEEEEDVDVAGMWGLEALYVHSGRKCNNA